MKNVIIQFVIIRSVWSGKIALKKISNHLNKKISRINLGNKQELHGKTGNLLIEIRSRIHL